MTESAAFVTSLSSPHEDYSSSKVLTGSSTVFIEGKAAARIGDTTDCGSKLLTGASTVNIG